MVWGLTTNENAKAGPCRLGLRLELGLFFFQKYTDPLVRDKNVFGTLFKTRPVLHRNLDAGSVRAVMAPVLGTVLALH